MEKNPGTLRRAKQGRRLFFVPIVKMAVAGTKSFKMEIETKSQFAVIYTQTSHIYTLMPTYKTWGQVFTLVGYCCCLVFTSNIEMDFYDFKTKLPSITLHILFCISYVISFLRIKDACHFLWVKVPTREMLSMSSSRAPPCHRVHLSSMSDTDAHIPGIATESISSEVHFP